MRIQTIGQLLFYRITREANKRTVLNKSCRNVRSGKRSREVSDAQNELQARECEPEIAKEGNSGTHSPTLQGAKSLC